MFYMVGLIRRPKITDHEFLLVGAPLGIFERLDPDFFGFRAKKRAETAKTADFGRKSSFLAQK